MFASNKSLSLVILKNEHRLKSGEVSLLIRTASLRAIINHAMGPLDWVYSMQFATQTSVYCTNGGLSHILAKCKSKLTPLVHISHQAMLHLALNSLCLLEEDNPHKTVYVKELNLWK